MSSTLLNEREVALFVRLQLNAGTAELEPRIAGRLFDARRAALARHANLGKRLAPASVGQAVLTWGRDNAQPFLIACALLATIACSNYFMSVERASELEEVDTALLADDLPIDAYLDKGFNAWLASGSPQQ